MLNIIQLPRKNIGINTKNVKIKLSRVYLIA
jgi:hypothetical protein